MYITAVIIEVSAGAARRRRERDGVSRSPVRSRHLDRRHGVERISGVATVVWTDALLFLMFIGGFVALLVGCAGPGGIGAAVDVGRETGKFLTPDGQQRRVGGGADHPYGAASVLVGASWASSAPTERTSSAQRMLACECQAQLAVLGSARW